MGLVRGFAAAGTRRMVASLWPVDDAATASLMERLYATDATPCATLAALARALREEGEHPAVWGAFCTIGGASAFGRVDTTDESKAPDDKGDPTNGRS